MELSFEDKLNNFAELAIRVGINLQKGQRLLIRAPIETAEFVRKLVDVAYKAGSPLVEVAWSDDSILMSRFNYAVSNSFDMASLIERNAMEDVIDAGGAIIKVYASDPELLKDVEPEKLDRLMRKNQAEYQAVSARMGASEVSWLVISVPIDSWSAKVFPNESIANQNPKLWDAIFQATRADLANPIEAWKEHLANLEERRIYLTNKQYKSLKYKSKDTDLTVGLVDNHMWLGGYQANNDGTLYVANLPTEEVFTMPHKDKINGIVKSTLPLSYSGQLIDGFSLEFKDGKVVKASAKKGEAALHKLLETDSGSSRLGEVALVPYSSPIRESGILFYNTLFDENASSHFALGRAYSFTVEGGTQMSPEELAKIGYNNSMTHVDFMIGSEDMDVDGITEDGKREAIMRAGEWVS